MRLEHIDLLRLVLFSSLPLPRRGIRRPRARSCPRLLVRHSRRLLVLLVCCPRRAHPAFACLPPLLSIGAAVVSVRLLRRQRLRLFMLVILLHGD